MKWILMFLLVLASVTVSAGELFEPYDDSVFTARTVFGVYHEQPTFVFPTFFDRVLTQESEVLFALPELEGATDILESVEIRITDDGFEPSEVRVAPGQDIVWVNARDRLAAQVIGVREATTLRSHSLRVGESFHYSFDEKGAFTYIDAVIIGYLGTIVVE